MAQRPGDSRGREAFVDVSTLADNLRRLRSGVDCDRVLVQVPCDAFGHGAERVCAASLDAGADGFVVGGIDEAVALRAIGVDAEVISWQHSPFEPFTGAAEHAVTPAVHDMDALGRAVEAGVHAVHLVPEIGGSQLGAAEESWQELCSAAARAQRAGRIEVTGIMAGIERYDTGAATAWDRAISAAHAHGLSPRTLHIGDYEPGHDLERYRHTAIRLGAALYGLSAFSEGVEGVAPVLTLTAPVLATKPAPPGVGVSYGYTHVTSEATTLLLVPLGYGDGIPRRSGNVAAGAVNGVTVPVIGRVAMDALVLDGHPLTASGTVPAVGEVATLIGTTSDTWSAQDWAEALGTTSLDIVARLTARITRTAP